MTRKVRLRQPPEVRLSEPESGRCYSPEQIDAILTKIEIKRDVKRKDFIKELESIAWWACAHENSPVTVAPASERQRDCGELAKQAERLRARVAALSIHLEEAGREMACRGDPPPGCLSLQVQTGFEQAKQVWLVDRQLHHLEEMLSWVKRCAERAADRAQMNKTAPGNRPASAIEFAVLAFARLFNNTSSHQAKAYKSRDTGGVRGNLIDFLEACLRPLGYRGDRSAVLRQLEKVKRSPG